MNVNKFYGTIFGQAIGDALGLGTEFMSKEEVMRHYPDGLTYYSQIIQDAHRCRWKKGAWTDDTEMMLCIMDALIENNGCVNLNLIAKKFKDWFNGNPLGIGRHTYNVLCFRDYTEDPIKAAEIIWTLYQKRSAANGGVMRTSVIGLIPDEIKVISEGVCRLTHPDMRCICSSVIVSLIIHEMVYRNHVMSYKDVIKIADEYDSRVAPFVHMAYDCKNIDELELCGTDMGYTLKTLAAALWSFWHSHSFEEGLLDVVNAGGDADTNAAVACSILGAKYGLDHIPLRYIEGLANVDRLRQSANLLLEKITP